MTETAPAKVRVLIAADEPLARDRLRLLLADEDWTELVGQCPDGPAAVAAIEKLRPDLVFLDVQMPGATGFDVIEAVGAAQPSTAKRCGRSTCTPWTTC